MQKGFVPRPLHISAFCPAEDPYTYQRWLCQRSSAPSGEYQTHTSQKLAFASPPDKPPIAIPGVSLATISLQHSLLISRSKPPCMMQNRFCFSGYLCAAMQRSSHLTDRSIASFILAWSGDVVAMTSSSCIIMSEPIEFWSDIECSGVRSLVV
jgi:hypothetical protein